MTAPCDGCWRPLPVADVRGVELCADCAAWLRRLEPNGPDGSEGSRLVRHFLAVWSDPARAARRAAGAAARADGALASVVEA